MWQFEWGTEPAAPLQFDNSSPPKSMVSLDAVESLHGLFWEEHCLECAVPDCYTTCELYSQRDDHKCARFAYGIWKNFAFDGPLGFGAEIHFKKWGKLQAYLRSRSLTPFKYKVLSQIDFGLSNTASLASSIVKPVFSNRKPSRVYSVGRLKYLLNPPPPDRAVVYDDLLIEVFSAEETSFRLVVETQGENQSYRTSQLITPGANVCLIPASALKLDFESIQGKLVVYPEADKEVRLVFSWLHLVQWKDKLFRSSLTDSDDLSVARKKSKPINSKSKSSAKNAKPASKIKCIAWDLDNTLWDGTLIESDPQRLQVRPLVAELIEKLDQKGVLQTVCSKNDHESAWAVLERLGLSEYFLYPAIHWGSKSGSIKAIADNLNIDVNTFGFIDDSAFERAEVSENLPQVRVYDEQVVDSLLSLPELDLPISAESSKRRLSYKADSLRKRVSAGFDGEYIEFLKDCEIRARVFEPAEEQHVARCFELLQRSNQLNLSTYRYTIEELRSAIKNPDCICVALEVSDRFGDYGLVGFARLDIKPESLFLRDWVASCRVARKKVENVWFQWMLDTAGKFGRKKITARFVKTERNGVLKDVLDEVGFTPMTSDDLATIAGDNTHETIAVLELETANIVKDSDVVLMENGYESCGIITH